MLDGMGVQSAQYKFYEANMGLPQLLTVTDERLQEIGIEFPYHRKRILLGLLQFHARPWSNDSLTIPSSQTNIVDIFNVLSSCLKQLIVIEQTMKFIEEHPIFDTTPMDMAAKKQRDQINCELHQMRKNIQMIFGVFDQVRGDFFFFKFLFRLKFQTNDLFTDRYTGPHSTVVDRQTCHPKCIGP